MLALAVGENMPSVEMLQYDSVGMDCRQAVCEAEHRGQKVSLVDGGWLFAQQLLVVPAVNGQELSVVVVQGQRCPNTWMLETTSRERQEGLVALRVPSRGHEKQSRSKGTRAVAAGLCRRGGVAETTLPALLCVPAWSGIVDQIDVSVGLLQHQSMYPKVQPYGRARLKDVRRALIEAADGGVLGFG